MEIEVHRVQWTEIAKDPRIRGNRKVPSACSDDERASCQSYHLFASTDLTVNKGEKHVIVLITGI